MRLALMRSAWSSSSEGSLAELASGLAELLPGLGHELGEHLRGRALGARQQARLVGRLHEPVEEVEVAVARRTSGAGGPSAPGAVRPGAAAAARPGRRRPDACAPRSFRNRSSRTSTSRTAPRASASHASSVAQRLGPLGVEHDLERPQVAAEPAGAHPGLVDAVGAEVEPDDRVVGQQALHRGGDGLLHERGHGGVRAERLGRGIGRRQRRRAQCPDQLGRGVGLRRPRPSAARRPPCRMRPSGAPAMASTSSSRKRAATRSPSSTVTSSSLTSARARPPPSRSTTTLRSLWRRATASERSPSQQARDGAGQLVGDLPGRGVHLDLGAVHRPAAGAGRRHLERPPTALAALAEPVAQRHVRADEAQIGGVVVGRVEVAVIGLGGGDAVVHARRGRAARSRARPPASPPARCCGGLVRPTRS